MARKQPSNSVNAALAAHQKASTINGFEWGQSGIQPLAEEHDRNVAQGFADQIYMARTEEHWQPHDFILIAQLANYLAEIERCAAQLREADYVVTKEGKSGLIQSRHPLLDVVGYLSQCASRIIAQLSISLKTPAVVVRNNAELQCSVTGKARKTDAPQVQIRIEDLL